MGMSGAATSSTCAPALSGAVRNKELFLTKEEIALRLAYVVDRLASWLKSGSRTEPATLMQLCYILARFSSNRVVIVLSFEFVSLFSTLILLCRNRLVNSRLELLGSEKIAIIACE